MTTGQEPERLRSIIVEDVEFEASYSQSFNVIFFDMAVFEKIV